MRQFMLKPVLHTYDNCKDFITEFDIGESDLIFTNKLVFNPYFGALDIKADVLFQDWYGPGEASDEMAEAIRADIRDGNHQRVIAIGDGTVMDLAKLFTLKTNVSMSDLFGPNPAVARDKKLVLVPTSCGSGSEVTNTVNLRLEVSRTISELSGEELYADSAVLIPLLLESLPYRLFAVGSIDALIRAAESFVSPRATAYTRLFAREAIRLIIRGYRDIARDGEMARVRHLPDFLKASNCAGISSGNTGTGMVRVLSRHPAGKYRIMAGEAGYALFERVFETYRAKRNNGAVAELGRTLADALGCDADLAFAELAELLDRIVPFQPLRHYGVTDEDIVNFTGKTVADGENSTDCGFVPLSAEEIREIYGSVL